MNFQVQYTFDKRCDVSYSKWIDIKKGTSKGPETMAKVSSELPAYFDRDLLSNPQINPSMITQSPITAQIMLLAL